MFNDQNQIWSLYIQQTNFFVHYNFGNQKNLVIIILTTKTFSINKRSVTNTYLIFAIEMDFNRLINSG
jgi:hypothetical protein